MDRSQGRGVADRAAFPDAGLATDLSGAPGWAAGKADTLAEGEVAAEAGTGAPAGCPDAMSAD